MYIIYSIYEFNTHRAYSQSSLFPIEPNLTENIYILFILLLLTIRVDWVFSFGFFN